MLSEGMNSLSPKERVKKGKLLEDAIANCLANHYNWKLEVPTVFEDTNQKIDRFLLEEDKRIPIQIKGRVSGEDILYDRYEPFFKKAGGIDFERTKDGRDHIGNYEIYVCLSRDQTTIRVVKTSALRRVISEMDSEWAESNYQLHFYSEKIPGCEFRYHKDQWSGRPKVLAFLNVKSFALDSEINFYEMKWD